ncbi:MAG TPA: chorismate mutase [Actinomycetota bacterium]|nr:chorismate mutase [Actinomycetota bacterium]
MDRTACRGIRGAITIDGPGGAAVHAATAELLSAITETNDCRTEDVAAVTFTVTDDLPTANPAEAARLAGWHGVPLLVVREHGGATGVPRCLRVLVLWNTPRTQAEIRHVYLGGAAALRPDLVTEGGTDGHRDAR